MPTPSRGRFMHLAKDFWQNFQDHHVLDGAAVLAFYFLLAAFPAAIFIFTLIPSLSIPHLQNAMGDLLHQILPSQSADLFQTTVSSVTAGRRDGLLSFGLIFALWSGSSGFSALMEQLTLISSVKDERPFWKARSIAILLT